MKRFKKLLQVVVCSFVLGSPIHIQGFQKVSSNGCSNAIYTNMNDFYKEKKNSIQVLALGDSNIYRGFSPVIYWQDKQITSYSLASASQPAWLSYYLLEDALTYQKPEVVIFEINELFAKSTGKIPRYCHAINTFHSDRARLRAIQDDTGGLDKEDKDILYEKYVSDVYLRSISKLFPSKASKKDAKKPNHLKGYLYDTTIIPFTTSKTYMSRYDIALSMDEKKVEYIDKIIALCKKNHSKLLFVKFPAGDWTSQKSEMAKQFSKERGITMLDMNVDVQPIDWMVDTKDAGYHMNDTGAVKCSKVIEEFVEKNQSVKPMKEKSVIESYEETLHQYLEQKKTGK